MTKIHLASALAVFAILSTSAAIPALAEPSLKADLAKGYLMKEQNRVPEAIVAFGAVLKKDPKNHAALSELGYLHAGLKQNVSAAKFLGAAALQQPDNARLRMDLGYVYQALKRRGDAQVQFKAVVALPGEMQAVALKELGFMNLADGRLQAAAANFEALRVLTPTDLYSVLQLGYTYDRLRKADQAREAYSAALASGDEKVRDAAQAALKASSSVPVSPVGSSL